VRPPPSSCVCVAAGTTGLGGHRRRGAWRSSRAASECPCARARPCGLLRRLRRRRRGRGHGVVMARRAAISRHRAPSRRRARTHRGRRRRFASRLLGTMLGPRADEPPPTPRASQSSSDRSRRGDEMGEMARVRRRLRAGACENGLARSRSPSPCRPGLSICWELRAPASPLRGARSIALRRGLATRSTSLLVSRTQRRRA